MIKNWLKWRKAKKVVAEDETCGISRKDLQRDSQLTSTAAYHTVMRPNVIHRRSRSCTGDLSINQYDAYNTFLDRSLYSDTIIPSEMIHRRRRHQHRFRRANDASTSEYGSGDPSSTTLYSTYNRNLDDSGSDSWNVEYQWALHIRELEYRLREQRKKLKEYKGRLRAERDLRAANERNMMEEVEKYKYELKKEQQQRKAVEERYIDIIAYMKTKLSILEQHQSMKQQCLPPSLPFLTNSSINLKSNMPQLGNTESARNSKNTTTTDTELSDRIHRSITPLKENDSDDDDDNGYVTTFEMFSISHIISIFAIIKFSWKMCSA
ncbi:Kinesin-IIsubunit [Dirofilaria immitis]